MKFKRNQPKWSIVPDVNGGKVSLYQWAGDRYRLYASGLTRKQVKSIKDKNK